MAYNGTIDLISGIRQKNGGTFPLVDASAVRVDDNNRLPAALDKKADGISKNGNTLSLTSGGTAIPGSSVELPEDHTYGLSYNSGTGGLSLLEDGSPAQGGTVSIPPYGSPLKAATVSAMTDTDKVYVYTGSETGYTAGHWYYHNGSAWTDGGAYNSVAFVTDTTLAVSGAAADAKVVGNEIANLKNAFPVEEKYNKITDTTIYSHGGNNYNFYVPLTVIPTGYVCIFEADIYTTCTFHYGLVGKTSNKVKYMGTENFTPGINSVEVINTFGEDCYIMLDAEANKLKYKSSGDLSYKLINSYTTGYPSVGDTIIYASGDRSSDFKVCISILPRVKEIVDRLNNQSDNIVELSGNVIQLKEAFPLEEKYNKISDSTIYSHGGTDYQFYVPLIEIPAGYFGILEADIYSACTFHFGLVGKSSNKVKYMGTVNFASGANRVEVLNSYDESCYIMLDASSDKIKYKSSGSLAYKLITSYTTGYPQVDDTISYAAGDRSSDFKVCISLIPCVKELTEYLNGEIKDLEDLFAPYSSLPFEDNESATSINKFLLIQKIPGDGVITKLYFKSGTSNTGTEVDIYDWDGTTVNQTFTPKRVYYVDVVNGEADVSIQVNKNEYIGIGDGATTVCAWDASSEGAGFVYLASATPTLYADKYITLSYVMDVNGSIGYLSETIKNNRFSVAPLENMTIFLAGDSRSSNDYTFYKSTLESKINCTALVQGWSGKTAALIASNEYFTRLANNPHDFSIWLVGGNDDGASGSIGTFSASSELAELGESVVTETDISQDYNGTKFIQAVDHIMRKYKYLYYDFKTLNNGHKPKMIFCTDLPQKRNNSSDAFSNPENWERKRLAILECCEKNNVACLDLLRLCNFDMSYEPYWTSPTDKIHDYGLYYMDGLHPNQYGIDIITSLEIEEMKKYISVNPYPAT